MKPTLNAMALKFGTARWLPWLLVLAVPTAADDLVLVGATVHTVSGDTLAPGQVWLRDGKIAAVGSRLPEATGRVVDLAGLQLYPGMIAANTTLGLVEINAVRATLDTTEVGPYTPEVQSWLAVNPDSELIPVARANGIAYAEPVPFGGVVSGYSGLIALAGWTIEDLVEREQVALHLNWPSARLDTTPKEEMRNRDDWKSLEDQARDRKEALRDLDEFFRSAETYAKTRADREPDAVDDLVPAWEAMRPFLDQRLPLVVHADDAREIKAAVVWARERGYRMVLCDGRDAWRVAALLAEHKVPVIYDHLFTLPPRDSEDHDIQFKAPRLLHEAGVKVVFSQGGRFEAASVRNLPYAAAQAVAFGLPADEALRGLTLYPAQVLGVEDRLGSIDPGKEATLFAADGDILDIRTQVKRLWIRGVETSLESRHTRLYDKYRNRPLPEE